MIKINLARRRKVSNAGAKGGLFGGMGGAKSLDTSALREFDWRTSPIPRVMLALLLVYFAQNQEESMKTERLREFDAKIEQIQQQQSEIDKKLAKVRGFEPLKKQLEDDEKLIQTKVNVITTLMEDREAPSRLMKQISQIIPEDVWLTSLGVKEGKLNITGGSSSYNMVSDFMNGLGVSSLLSEVSLAQINETQKDGVKFQQFDISAKRRAAK